MIVRFCAKQRAGSFTDVQKELHPKAYIHPEYFKEDSNVHAIHVRSFESICDFRLAQSS